MRLEFSLRRSSIAALALSCAIGTILPTVGQVVPTPLTATDENSIPFVAIRPEVQSKVSQFETHVIQETSTWHALWTRHDNSVLRATPAPEVDFNTHTILAIFLGKKPSLGYSVQIKSISRSTTGWTVNFRTFSPPPTAPVAAVVSRPYQIVSTEKLSGVVRFQNVQDEK